MSRLQAAVAVLLIGFMLSGCSGFTDSVKSGMSKTANYLAADTAETEGDAAYQNKDYTRAAAAYRKAAEAEGGYGQFMLASMYLAGEGVKRDPRQHLHWMRQSAENGYPPANYLMGIAYLPHNPTTARQYLETAAKDEHGAAMHLLGLMYASGTGVEQNDRQALRWFRRAKAQGIPVADRFLSEAGVQAYMTQINQRAAQAQQANSARQKMVREIQQILTDLGYAPGPIDGLFGGKTRAAIASFQREKGLEPDGKPTPRILEILRKSL